MEGTIPLREDAAEQVRAGEGAVWEVIASVGPMTNTLPDDIVKILEHLADWASGYDNHLKWNEEAKLKADLMHNRRYWVGFPTSAVRVKCVELGMCEEDVSLIADLVGRAQQGRRLVPQRSYRDHVFRHDRPQTEEPPTPLATSREW